MPQMANITVKKADGTTDVIYVNQAPASGDSTPARWRVDAIGTVPANRPVFTIMSKSASNGSTRVVSGKLVLPEIYTDTTTNLVSIRSSVSLSFEGRVPQLLSDTTIAEAAAQFANLLKSTLIQDSIKTGYAPS